MKAILAGALFLLALSASAQEQDSSMAGMNMPGMNMDETPSQLPSPHAGSGTGWQPASVPANDWMWMRGGWELMAHGVIFTDYNQQGGPRGDRHNADRLDRGRPDTGRTDDKPCAAERQYHRRHG